MSKQYTELDTKVIKFYLDKLNSVNDRGHVLLDDFNDSLTNLAAELLAIYITSNNKDETLNELASALDLFSNVIITRNMNKPNSIPLTPAEKAGLRTAKSSKTEKNEILNAVFEIEKSLNLN